MVRYNSKGELLIYSHGSWLTEKEDAKACDRVDAIMQWDRE